MKRILVNKVRCKKCDDVIESTHSYDFKRYSLMGERIISVMDGQ